MARPKSIILTPAEKKKVIADLKQKIRTEKVNGRNAAAALKTAERAFKTAQREYDTFVKAHTASDTRRLKAIEAFEAQIAALSAPAPAALSGAS